LETIEKQSKPIISTHQPRGHTKPAHTSSFTTTQQTCILCHKLHHIGQCNQFLDLSPSKRYDKAKLHRLCINYLSPNHTVNQCSSSHCRVCQQKHNTALHFDDRPPQQQNNRQNKSSHSQPHIDQNKNQSSNQERKPPEVQSTHCSNVNNNRSQVLLSTAVVNVYDKFGNPHPCRVLLDSASQSNFITYHMVQLLQMKRFKSNISINGINQSSTKIAAGVNVRVS
jgi:hypothetical protein